MHTPYLAEARTTERGEVNVTLSLAPPDDETIEIQCQSTDTSEVVIDNSDDLARHRWVEQNASLPLLLRLRSVPDRVSDEVSPTINIECKAIARQTSSSNQRYQTHSYRRSPSMKLPVITENVVWPYFDGAWTYK